MDANLRLTGVRSGMLRPNIVLPSQYFGPPRRLTPERGLMIAVLQDAIDCVARLTGTVPTGMQRLEAAVVARSTLGVCSVQDDLRVAD